MSFENFQPEQYAGKLSFFEGESPLPQSVGYAVVLGFGIAFSIFTTAIVYIERCFSADAAMTSEKFK
jgi:hypothetical protein